VAFRLFWSRHFKGHISRTSCVFFFFRPFRPRFQFPEAGWRSDLPTTFPSQDARTIPCECQRSGLPSRTTLSYLPPPTVVPALKFLQGILFNSSPSSVLSPNAWAAWAHLFGQPDSNTLTPQLRLSPQRPLPCCAFRVTITPLHNSVPYGTIL